MRLTPQCAPGGTIRAREGGLTAFDVRTCVVCVRVGVWGCVDVCGRAEERTDEKANQQQKTQKTHKL